jgi:putative phage-type endonuclease
MPILVTIEQRTPQWLEWRSTGLGGSDASAIMCENPFTSPYKLWTEKVGKRAPKKVNRAMERGTAMEREAIDALTQHLGEFLPPACLQHDEHPFMLSSLDGYMPPDVAAEVKVPTTPHTHLLAREGQVPRLYYAQCQHNLHVSGCKMLYFASYYPKDEQMPLAVVPVQRDEAYLADLIAAEREFWRWVTEKQFPEYEGATDLNRDPRWVQLAGELWQADQSKQVANDRYDSIQGEMKRIAMLAKTQHVRGAGVTATWIHQREYTKVQAKTVYLKLGHSAAEDDNG